MSDSHPIPPDRNVPVGDVAVTASIAERERLRREMRRRRRDLSQRERMTAADAIAQSLYRHRVLRPGAHVAAYIAHRGEVDLGPTLARARSQRCNVYLPSITRADAGLMRFVRFDDRRALRRNRFGILEPHRCATSTPVRRLDVVLLPLVAVDAHGWRLGSGAGFYDRSLAHLKYGRRWRRPRLIGVAYEFQRVPQLEPQPWDVPLDAVVTERGFYPTARLST
jgi:5-formyltetrahydrofolate cyclo-ligase